MLRLIKTSVLNWYNNDPFTRSAAIAYYTIFSFPALLIILMGIANKFIDEKIIETSIIGYLRQIIGKEAAIETFQVVDRVNLSDNNTLIFIFGVLILLYSSLRLFIQLQKGLNEIWGVDSTNIDWRILVKRRVYSFGLMISIGFILIVSLLITSALTALSDWMSENLSDYTEILIYLINFMISFCVLTFLFTLILKILPDTHIDWKTAAAGGIVTTILFSIGEYTLSIYFDLAEPQSTYGVSGSIILLMLWISYSVVILLYGAEFSRSYNKYKNEK